MIFYRIGHYVFFLFLGFSTALYFMRGNVTAALGLDSIFIQIDSLYASLPKVEGDEASFADFQNKAENLFADVEKSVDALFSDISFPNAIRSLENRNVNDIEYLVYEHLENFPYFKDFLVYREKDLIYKYHKTSTDTSIILRYNEDRNIFIEVHFNENLIYSLLNKFSVPLFLKDSKGYIYFPKSYISNNADISKSIRNISSEKSDFKGKNLYTKTIFSNFKNPIELYGIYEKKKARLSFLQILFILMWPLFWVFCIGLDFIIYRKISLIRTEKGLESSNWRNSLQKHFLKNNLLEEENANKEMLDQTLEWIDNFIESESRSSNILSNTVPKSQKFLGED